MSYTDLIQGEGLNHQYLCVLVPARKVTNWTNITGNIYYTDFDYGYVNKIEVDGVLLELDTSTSPALNKYYYHHQTQKIYINTSSPSTKFITVYYELYVCTRDLHWYREPLNSASQEVFFDGYIIQPPSFRATLSEQLLGYIPSQTTSMVLVNAEHQMERHLYDSSFQNKDIYVYHWIGDLDTANMKLIQKGLMGPIDYQGGRVSINIVDRIDLFNQEYRNRVKSFYNTTDFPNVNPNFIGKPIRYVFGVMDNLTPVNVDYVGINQTNNDNRVYVVREGSLNSVTRTVQNGSTTTRTYLDSTNGLQVGDCVKINKATDEYVEITAIGVTYIEHATLSSGAAVLNDTVERQTIGYFHIEQGDIIYKVPYNLFTCSVSNNVVVVTLDSSVESTLGIELLNGSDSCYIRVYGESNWVTKGGSAFGSDSTKYACLTNPAVIMFELIKRSGVQESDIDLASFDALSTDIGSVDIGFSLPFSSYSDFDLYKDILIKIMQSTLSRLFINNNNKWEVGIIEPLGTASTTIADDEILFDSIGYQITNIDTLSQAIVGYAYNEKSSSYKTSSYQSNVAVYLHKISKQKTFNTYLINETDASTLARRFSYIYGDRYGYMTLKCKNRFLNNDITDIIKVELYKMLGYDYDTSVLRNRTFDLIEIVKTLRSITFKLNDQKGIEDNSSSW